MRNCIHFRNLSFLICKKAGGLTSLNCLEVQMRERLWRCSVKYEIPGKFLLMYEIWVLNVSIIPALQPQSKKTSDLLYSNLFTWGLIICVVFFFPRPTVLNCRVQKSGIYFEVCHNLKWQCLTLFIKKIILEIWLTATSTIVLCWSELPSASASHMILPLTTARAGLKRWADRQLPK